jgi:hypothetical protein
LEQREGINRTGASAPNVKEQSMTALIDLRDQSGDSPRLGYHDLVRTPGGRVGAVVGFYRRDTESVLVRFAADDCTEFLSSDVEPCRRAAADVRSWIGWD